MGFGNGLREWKVWGLDVNNSLFAYVGTLRQATA